MTTLPADFKPVRPHKDHLPIRMVVLRACGFTGGSLLQIRHTLQALFT